MARTQTFSRDDLRSILDTYHLPTSDELLIDCLAACIDKTVKNSTDTDAKEVELQVAQQVIEGLEATALYFHVASLNTYDRDMMYFFLLVEALEDYEVTGDKAYIPENLSDALLLKLSRKYSEIYDDHRDLDPIITKCLVYGEIGASFYAMENSPLSELCRNLYQNGWNLKLYTRVSCAPELDRAFAERAQEFFTCVRQRLSRAAFSPKWLNFN